ncbi:MAG: hypothetical protein WA765_09865 [Candidatus Acidiferrum sp.]
MNSEERNSKRLPRNAIGWHRQTGKYALTEDHYEKLFGQLAGHKCDLTSPDLRANVLNFYSDLSLPFDTKMDAGNGKAFWYRWIN